MENYDIYLAGGMSGLSMKEQNQWRKDVIKFIEEIIDDMHGNIKKPIFFNPVMYYNYIEGYQKSEKEVMMYELSKLRASDLVIVNFNNPNSVGTVMEVTTAYERRIPIVGLNKNKCALHPWLEECCTRICDDTLELGTYVYDFFLS